MSSSLTPLPVERPSLRLSSACPIPPDDWRDGEIAAPAVDTGLEDAFRTHGGALLRYVRRQAGPDEASDLVQEVFARAAGSKQRHRLINPGGFLRRIAQNLLIDLGPEGGAGGGCILATGTPEQIAAAPASHSGRFLTPLLR